MTPNLKFPSESAKYISMQRLETQTLGGNIHYNGLGAIAYRLYEKLPFARNAFKFYSINIEPKIRSGSIIAAYVDVMKREFESIADHMGDNLETIVSVGPGMAGLEVMISQYCHEKTGRRPHIVLIDKTGIDPIKYGFHTVAAVYNSLDIAQKILIDNHHPANLVQTVDAADAPALADTHAGKVDLVTSLIAWGFHFPVDTYLALVLQILKPSGRLIIDVRKGTDGRKKLEAAFNVDVILDDPKFERICATRRP